MASRVLDASRFILSFQPPSAAARTLRLWSAMHYAASMQTIFKQSSLSCNMAVCRNRAEQLQLRYLAASTVTVTKAPGPSRRLPTPVRHWPGRMPAWRCGNLRASDSSLAGPGREPPATLKLRIKAPYEARAG